MPLLSGLDSGASITPKLGAFWVGKVKLELRVSSNINQWAFYITRTFCSCFQYDTAKIFSKLGAPETPRWRGYFLSLG